MKKAEYKEMDTKDLRARLETAEKEYLQTKVNHSISPLDNLPKDYTGPSHDCPNEDRVAKKRT